MRTPLFGAALLASAACACARKEPQPEPLAPPQMELAGCSAVARDGVCDLASDVDALVVWLDRPGLTLRAHWSEAELSVAEKPLAEGTLARVSLPAPPREPAELTLDVALDGRVARLPIKVRSVSKEPSLERAKALRREGKIDEARSALPTQDGVGEALRGRAASLAARLSLSEGHVDEAIEGLGRAAQVHRAKGRVSDEALDWFALCHTLLMQKHDLVGARRALEEATSALFVWSEGRAHAAYYGALVDLEGGHIAEALDGLDRAEAGAQRLALDSLVDVTRDYRVLALQNMGRTEEAQRALEVMHNERPKDQTPCREAELLNNLGWVEVLRAEAGEAWNHAGVSSLVEAADIFRRSCPRPIHAQTALINLGLLRLAEGAPTRAADALHAARSAHDEPSFELVSWLLDAEGRLALAQGRTDEALARYAELATRASAAASDEAQFRAALGRAAVFLQRGKPAAAAEAFAAADALLDSEAARVPLGEGRASFLAGRARASDGLAQTLVALDRAPDALQAVRRARRRVLSAAEGADRLARLQGPQRGRWEEAIAVYRKERDAIDVLARDDWKVSADKLPARNKERDDHRDAAQRALELALSLLSEGSAAPSDLPPLRDDEALLVVSPSTSGGLVFFAKGADVRAASLAKDVFSGGAEALATALFGPFQSILSETKHIRILGDDRMGVRDIHALPLQGRPLSLAHQVEYAVDLPRVASALRPQTALVVADPRDDLPGAKREAGPVAAAFGGTVIRLEGAVATRDALLGAMKQADLMHFAGHGVFGEGTGITSRLLLAGGAELTAGDILVLGHVPFWVMLSGCETAKTESRRVTGLGLATAFLAAGSDVVIAASRPVSDKLGAAMSEAVHRALGQGAEPSEALRQAANEVSERLSGSDWAAYRAIAR